MSASYRDRYLDFWQAHKRRGVVTVAARRGFLTGAEFRVLIDFHNALCAVLYRRADS